MSRSSPPDKHNSDDDKKSGLFKKDKGLRKKPKKNDDESGPEETLEGVEEHEIASTSKSDSFQRSNSKRKSKKYRPTDPSSSSTKKKGSSEDSSNDEEYVPTKKKKGGIRGLFSKLKSGRKKSKLSDTEEEDAEEHPKQMFKWKTREHLPETTNIGGTLSTDDTDDPEPDKTTHKQIYKWKTREHLPETTNIGEMESSDDSDDSKVDKKDRDWNPDPRIGRKNSKTGKKSIVKSDDSGSETVLQKNLPATTNIGKTVSKDDSDDFIIDQKDKDWRPGARVKRKKTGTGQKSTVESDDSGSDTDSQNIHEPLYLGEQNNECYHCGALHLPGKHYCCSNGRVFIPPFPKIEEPLKTYLFDINSHARNTFIRRILNYNSLFSFASIQRHRLKAAKYGPQVEKSQGPLRHFPSAAYPKNSRYPNCGNYYVFDPEEAAEKRMNNPLALSLDNKIIHDITAYLHLHNHFATMYKTMAECMEEAKNAGNNPDHLRLKIIDPHNVNRKILENQHPGIYKTKTHGKDFLSVFYDCSIEQEIKYPGLIIYPKRSNNPCRPLYPWMQEVSPLCYPIIFPKGEPGWKSNKFPIQQNRELSWYDRLEAYARFHKEEADMWDTDTEEQDDRRRTHLEGDPYLEVSDDENDENTAHNYYDNHLQHLITDDIIGDLPENISFLERNGEIYPTRQPTDNPSKLHQNVELDADLDVDSDVSETEFVPDTLKSTSETTEELDKDIGTDDESVTATDKIKMKGKHEEPSCSHTEKKHRNFASFREYGLFIHQKRKRFRNRIAASRKLGQLLTIDMVTRLREFRNSETRMHQTEYVTSNRKKYIKGYEEKAEKKGVTIGCATSVPSTVPGSPRNLQQLYEAIIALTNKLGRPDLFITFTCNVLWKEILENLEPGTSWEDNPFLVNEIFTKRFEEFLNDVIGKPVQPGSKKREKGMFGHVLWYTYSIEFQARGPPHAHLIISLKKHIKTAAEVDKICQAQLPVVPDPSHPDYDRIRRLRELVETFMIHRPCENDPEAYCNANRKAHWKQCVKHYPKTFNRFTKMDDRQYPELCRPDNGEYCIKKTNVGDAKADNTYVVPHNLDILSRHECHCNVEVISSLRVVKYIFKYIFKGFDRVLVEAITNSTGRMRPDQMTLEGHLFVPSSFKIPKGILEERNKEAIARLKANNVPLIDKNGRPVAVYDETYLIEDMRSTTAPEAAWEFMGLHRSGCSHQVVPVFVHTPGEEPVKTDFGDEAQAATYKKLMTEEVPSRLKSWFEVNKSTKYVDKKAKSLTYDEMPKFFVYENLKWRRRKIDMSEHILGRIKSVPPRNLQQFAIRILASCTRGPKSFEELRTVDGELLPSFSEACKRRGLMNDEAEWDFALYEAEQGKMPPQLRRLFISILLFCAPKNPRQLWESHKEHLFERRGDWSEAQKEAQALHHISFGLRYHGTSLSNFELPAVCETNLPHKSELVDDGLTSDFNTEESHRLGEENKQKLTEEQFNVFQTVMTSVDNGLSQPFFIEGGGGSGKTFVYKTLYYNLVGKGYKVLCVAHTGVASILLPHGSTAHRTFCIPLLTEETMSCKIDLESNTAIDLYDVSVVLWDEIVMTDYRIIHSVHKLLCHIHPEKADLPFGGCTFVFGGDFRQTLPIVEGVRDSAIVNYTIRGSQLWTELKVLHLSKNIRASEDLEFANWLLTVGSGTANLDRTIREMDQEVNIPEKCLVNSEKTLINTIFGNNQLLNEKSHGSVILTVDNRTSLEVNETILKMLPGKETLFCSIDTYDDTRGFAALDTECYNILTPSGMAPHKLRLKENCIVILLRNLDVTHGLCNGTRLRVLKIQPNVLTCIPLKGYNCKPEMVYIHRIMQQSSCAATRELAFSRKQFPLRLAYSLTVNKGQGQTFDRVGLLLRTPCFTHGQLYVALSRVRKFENLLVYNANKKNRGTTSNVVFQRALI